VVGLDAKGTQLAQRLRSHYPTATFDLCQNPGSYRECDLESGVYYLSGQSEYTREWSEIKAHTAWIGRRLQAGDWVIFGQEIDPDMAEVVLLPILESESKMNLGEGFECAFDPRRLKKSAIQYLSQDLKLSHNILIDAVKQILQLELKYPIEKEPTPAKQSSALEDHIAEEWVPVLNAMNQALFQDFVKACRENNFLDDYPRLKKSGERQVDVEHFFQLARKNGLSSGLCLLLNEWSKARHRAA